jgi:hypothetical protein
MSGRIPLVLILILIVVTVLTCGCMKPGLPETQPSPSPSPAPTVAVPLTIHINATPQRYNPAMSSTIGILLLPVNTSGIIPPDAQFTWRTNFGTFYRWLPPDFKVVELGPTYTGTVDPVYWSYFSGHGEKYRRPVDIILSVTEPSTGNILANATLRIGWEDPLGFTAIVEGQG